MATLALKALTAVLLAAGLGCGPQGPAQAEEAPRPVPIEAWSLERVSAMGQALYRQDSSAWVATDALVDEVPRELLANVRGWIVLSDGAKDTVRFIREGDDGPRAAWDVVVENGRTRPVVTVTDGRLSPEEEAQFLAVRTARANIGSLRCSQNLNTAVLRDPDSDGWLVWLLTSTTQAGIIPVGGHYRFKISADGRRVLRRDQLSNTCLNIDRNAPRPSEALEGIVVSQIVSDTPVETHVFLSLQNRLPIYVSAGERLFAVEGARIREVNTAAPRSGR